jgi:hypothetical protein
MKYDVWIEGYAVTGQQDTAQLLGSSDKHNFEEACEEVLKTAGWDMSYWNPERCTHWGCRLFDNETDARKSFG